ncbi:MAG: helix-turn-helix transcriptional regulator, partial [Terrimicrobiaceae bacterium]
FSRLFKRVTGRTCTAFINEIRLGHACRLLQETAEPITGISLECGFHNLSNFNRQFRTRYRCSPREYRRQGHRVAPAGAEAPDAASLLV